MSDPADTALQSLITHFGEMARRWGISRSVGQVYAYVLFSSAPRNADQIGAALGFSRSNVSLALKELQAWNLLRLSHHSGDRKEYFSAPDSLWDVALTIMRERRRRELDPMRDSLRQVVETAEDATTSDADRHARARAAEMLEFVELLVKWSEEIQTLRHEDLQRLIKLGGGVAKVLELTGRTRR